MARSHAQRRAAHLARWYPATWRARYGDEFVEMLRADLEERPRSWRRTIDVAVHGLSARLAVAGMAGDVLGPDEQAHASLAAFGCALGAFLVFGVATWAQLTVGWEWSAPAAAGTALGMVVMSCAAALIAAVVLLAAVPVVVGAVRLVIRGRGRCLAVPALALAMGVGLLVAGGHHFGNGWPGTHGHPWSHQGMVPGGVAAFLWASTLSVSAYWAHPAALSGFPTLEVVWMAVSPVAIVLAVAGAAMLVRRIELSRGAIRFELRLLHAAFAAMVLFFAGASLWVVRGGAGPRNLFHAGAIDVAALVVMVAALASAYRALRRAHRGSFALA